VTEEIPRRAKPAGDQPIDDVSQDELGRDGFVEAPTNSVVEFAPSPAAKGARVLSTLSAKRPSPAGP
jgi:hypothetical protein